MALGLIPVAVPRQIGDSCVDTQELNCNGEIASDSVVASDFKIVYPTFVLDTMPLAGGAVVRIDISGLKLKSEDDIIDVLRSEVSDIGSLPIENRKKEISKDIDNLNILRLAVNSALFKIGSKKIKITTNSGDKPRKAPKLFLSTIVGDDSFLIEDVLSPEVSKICEFEYIPFQILQEIAVQAAANEDLAEVVGSSGATFTELKDDLAKDEASLVRLINEFFPIYNISETDILFRTLNASLGGYYTIDNSGENGKGKFLYLKMPNVSGADIEGFTSELFTEDQDRKLYFEIQQSSNFQRINVTDYLAPPTATLLDNPEDFPEEEEPLELVLATGMSDASGLKAYLSVLSDSRLGGSGGSAGVTTFSQRGELFSVPLLVEGLDDPAIAPTIDVESESFKKIMNNSKGALNSFFKGFEDNPDGSSVKINGKSIPYDELGAPFAAGNFDENHFFGEKNRPDIVIAKGSGTETRKENRRTNKNTKQFLKPKAAGASKILASNRPRLYRNVPATWIEASIVSHDANAGTLSVTFTNSNFDILNREARSSFEFYLYLQDKLGQITKVPGSITLTTSTPSLTSVTPNGFSGGPRVTLNKTALSITFDGDDLSNLYAIEFATDPEGNQKVYQFDGFNSKVDDFLLITSDSTAQIVFTGGSTLGQVGNGAFSSSQRYYIRAVDTALTKSSALQFYIADETQDLPALDPQPVTFNPAPNRLKWAKGISLAGIPVLSDGQNAQIKLVSKDKAFKKGNEIFAYIAVPEGDKDALDKLATDSDQVLVRSSRINEFERLTIPKNIQYTFSTSPLGSFYRLSNKRAILQFPGPEYAGFNFSDFTKLDRAYIIIVNQKITGDVTLTSENHVMIEIASSRSEAFISPPNITNIVVVGSKENTSAAPVDKEKDGDILDALGISEAKVGSISAFKGIKQMVITFKGDDHDGKPNKRNYTFKLGNTKINGSLSSSIEHRARQRRPGPPGELLAVFEDVTTREQGLLSVSVEKKDRDFNVTLRSTFTYRQVSALLKPGSYEIDSEDGSLITSNLISAVLDDESEYGFITGKSGDIEPAAIANLLVPAVGSGILLTSGDPPVIQFYNSASILTNIALTLFINGEDGPTDILDFVEEDDVSSIQTFFLGIPDNSVVRPGNYYIDSEGNAIIFVNARFGNPAAIKFNVAEVTGIILGRNKKKKDAEAKLATATLNGIDIIAGEEYTVAVKGAISKNFIIALEDPEGLARPTVKPKKVKRTDAATGEYIATITIPDDTLSFSVNSSKCFDICASTSNHQRNGAKLTLGGPFVVDVDEQFKKLLLGPLLDKIPAIGDLKEFLENFPLRFLQFELKIPPIAKALIQSFCDFSFHLLAELKFALNGFQALLIPMQVIFCIIDVICSLLNPIKLARAVIRLFQCLYDLVLLLPVISVPVMLLQLILHILELLECVIEKILYTIIAVNEIIKALDRAFTEKTFEALLALEEVLSQYLFEIEADLSFLDPVLAILAIFLQILQLIFRFPCKLAPGEENDFCLDGSLLAGIVASHISEDTSDGESIIIPDALIPVAQPYTTLDEVEAAALRGGSENGLEEPSTNDVIARQTANQTYLESMDVDQASLRGTNFDFEATFQPTFTKSKKKGGSAVIVEFQFKEKARNSFLRPSKVFSPEQTMDSPIRLMRKSGNDIVVAGTAANASRNFISPIDGYEFLNANNNTKPLSIDFEIPVRDDTGAITDEVEIIPITYDDIPSLAIMDEVFNLYFIEKDGIEFDDDFGIKSIQAKMVNNIAAEKLKFSREEEEFLVDEKDPSDPNDDEYEDVKVYDFPQIFFVDMRQAGQDIAAACEALEPATFLLDDNDSDEITEIVEDAEDCLETWRDGVLGLVENVRASLDQGVVPAPISIDTYDSLNNTVRECLSDVADNICRFVVNTLNTSFQVQPDEDDTPREDVVDIGTVDESLLEGFEEDGPPFTGAREYAAGIGDNAQIGLGEVANVSLIPRDSYDTAILGDLTEKITIEIVSDTSGDAEFVRNEDGSILTKNGTEYTAKLSSNREGVVKLRAKVCGRTIQAATLNGLEISEERNAEVDCIPDTVDEATGGSPSLGSLIRVDRILTVYFVRKASVAIAEADASGEVAHSNPQEFGTGLEN